MAWYQSYNPTWWQGRNDGHEQAQLRWHQVVKGLDFEVSGQHGIALLGFECDEGVRRNQGRPGARKGPEHLQNALANLPVHGLPALFDAGNVLCDDENLEGAQQLLARTVERIIATGCFPVVLGGGHEMAWGHYQGLAAALPDTRIGIINIDAHLDLRATEDGRGHSGSPFYQIHRHCRETGCPFEYLALGVQKHANTASLFEYADSAGATFFLDREMDHDKLPDILAAIQDLAGRCDHLYLTVCLDAFNAAHAPGVSAVNGAGLHPGPLVRQILSAVAHTGKLASLDIAELNPEYDIDSRTARLGAWVVFEVLDALGSW